MPTTPDTLTAAQAMVNALEARHGVDVGAVLNATADEHELVAPALFDDLDACAYELALTFDCNVELLRRGVRTLHRDDERHTAAEALCLFAAIRSEHAGQGDEARAWELFERAFSYHVLPVDPAHFAPRHARRALALLDDAAAVDQARANVRDGWRRVSGSDRDLWLRDVEPLAVDDVRALLAGFVERAASLV